MKNQDPQLDGAVEEPIDQAASERILPSHLAELIVAVEEVRKERKKNRRREKKEKEIREGGLGTSRGIETMFRTSYRVNMDLSSLADAKSNIMISINGIIISILLASISPKIDTNSFLLIPTTVLLVGCLLSLVYAVLAARPRVSSRLITMEDVRANRANILFFGNFAQIDEDMFVEAMTELLQKTDGLYLNMIRDIYGLGSVLFVKYRLLRISYTIFMIGLVVGVLLFIGMYFFQAGTAPPSNTFPTNPSLLGL